MHDAFKSSSDDDNERGESWDKVAAVALLVAASSAVFVLWKSCCTNNKRPVRGKPKTSRKDEQSFAGWAWNWISGMPRQVLGGVQVIPAGICNVLNVSLSLMLGGVVALAKTASDYGARADHLMRNLDPAL